MKTNKLAIFFVCCLAAVSMTFMSCSDDDNNDGSLSKTDYQIAFNAVRGDYTERYTIPFLTTKLVNTIPTQPMSAGAYRKTVP